MSASRLVEAVPSCHADGTETFQPAAVTVCETLEDDGEEAGGLVVGAWGVGATSGGGVVLGTGAGVGETVGAVGVAVAAGGRAVTVRPLVATPAT
ncbi:MAG TPA: hypothetical protein VE781_13135, partial [Kineosporiaceae bacterium]|nr:hypothetical protein [Kineosporiaceae bacterium]